MEITLPGLLMLGLVLYAIFFLIQFLDLMQRKDDEFPARFDKPIWVAVMVLAPLLGVVTFWVWKKRVKFLKNPSPLEREWLKIKAQRDASGNEAGRSNDK